MFTVLLAMPLAVPEFVHGYCWVSLFPSVQGFWGAVLVMTTSLYPLVFLPVAATLRRSDAATEEVARSLGHSRWRVLWRVTLPQTRPALAGGALLVSLYLLGEYGAFAMVRYTTFATAIYTQFETSFDTVSASVLALVLIVLAVLVTGAEAGAGRAGARSGWSGKARDPARQSVALAGAGSRSPSWRWPRWSASRSASRIRTWILAGQGRFHHAALGLDLVGDRHHRRVRAGPAAARDRRRGPGRAASLAAPVARVRRGIVRLAYLTPGPAGHRGRAGRGVLRDPLRPALVSAASDARRRRTWCCSSPSP